MKFAQFGFTLFAAAFSSLPCFAANPTIDPQFFRPFQGELAVLSPDGRHLVYTVRQRNSLGLAFVDLERPESKTTLSLANDAVLARGPQSREVVPASLRFLQWSDASTLVFQLHAATKAELRDEVWRVDADGKNERKLVTADDLAFAGPEKPAGSSTNPSMRRSPRVLGFDPVAPEMLFVEAEGSGDAPTESFSIHLSTGKSTSLGSNESHHRYLYDRRGHARIRETERPWSSPDLEQHYELVTPSGWEDLDRFLGGNLSLGFEFSPGRYFGPRSLTLAFDGDEETLYFASNKHSDKCGIYALDLRTKRRTDFAVEDSVFDLASPEEVMDESLIVFDRKDKPVGVRLRGSKASTRWFDTELAQVQRMLDDRFTGRTAKIVNWDDARKRFLVSVYAPNDPGRYYIFEPGPRGFLTEVLRCAPKLEADLLSPVNAFSFVTSDQVTLSGTLVLPRRARASPLPLVVYGRDLPGRFDDGDFDREAQALALTGFAVARINTRGTPGLGLTHLLSAKGGLDRRPIEDIRAAVAWLSEHFPVSRNHVALLGEGFGAYVALRALEHYPDEFSCALALDLPPLPPLTQGNLSLDRRSEVHEREFFGKEVSTYALTRDAGLIKRPVFLVATRGHSPDAYNPSADLRQALRRLGPRLEYSEINDEILSSESDGKAKLFLKIVSFLNAHIYENATDLAPFREVQ